MNDIAAKFQNPTPEFVEDMTPVLKQQLAEGKISAIKGPALNEFFRLLEIGQFDAETIIRMKRDSLTEWKREVQRLTGMPEDWFRGRMVYRAQEHLLRFFALEDYDLPDIDIIHRRRLVKAYGEKYQPF